MSFEKVAYGPWKDAWRCVSGEVEMIVLTEVGPRIISLCLAGGPNILFEDKTGKMGLGEWRIRGGHRFWIQPESQRTYEPDNEPVAAEVDGATLRATRPPDVNRIQKILEITPGPQQGGFTVRHVLRNTGPTLAYGGLWGLTCIVPHRVLIPWRAGSSGWDTPMVRYFRRWGKDDSTNIESPQWQPRNGRFVIEPTGEVGKIGLYSEAGWIALERPDATLRIAYPVLPGLPHPDDGCNLEFFTCDQFIELETCSPLYTLHPGKEYSHVERWLLTERTFAPEDWEQIGELAKK